MGPLSRSPVVRVFLVALVALAIGCQRDAGIAERTGAAPGSTSSAYPIEIRDDLGRTVSLPAEPRRIVSLLPSHTETLFALGVGARVVGVDDYSDDPPEAARLPRLGGLYDAHLEEIVSLEPDLVLVSEQARTEALERSGLTVWGGSARSFEDVFRVIQTIGRMLNRISEATRLSETIRKEVVAVEQRAAAGERVSVYYELDAAPYTVGPSSFVGVMLEKAGGDNVIPAGLGDFPRVSPELVIAGNPSVILGVPLADLVARPGWNRIAAVRDGRVYRLPPEESRLVVRPGPRIAEGMRVLARRLHPGDSP